MKLTEMKRLRRAAGLTQRELADRAGISESVVYTAETGRFAPRVGNLEKIAEALDVEVSDLFPKGSAPKSEHETSETEGRHQVRTASSHVAPITARASVVTVDAETLRTALRAVEAGLMSAEMAEDRLLAGVA